MKKVKTVGRWVIATETPKTSTDYSVFVFTKGEWEYGAGYRTPDWECDSIQEALEWIDPDDE